MNELEPGRPVEIAPTVQRLVAPNASLMTGPGTNTYLLGDPPCAVIDPGPDDPRHLDVIRRVAPRLEVIFATHTHPDHSCGARTLHEQTGARLIGLAAPANGPQDRSFIPQSQPGLDERFALPFGTLRAIHTPGHASNHVCYLFEEQRLLFSGDHVLDGVTPVIAPPDGDMAAYLESLRRLLDCDIAAIAPGHGSVLHNPTAVIQGVIAHRARREAKVRAALTQLTSGRLDDLLNLVYADVQPRLYGLARQSLEAHLIKLSREGFCTREGDQWRVVTSKRD